MFSIIIPAYNCEKTIAGTLNSVLQQDYADFELIVVDDGSSDGTGAVLETHKKNDERVKIYTTHNGGPAQARNLGMRHAAKDYLMFVDSDDKLAPGALSLLAAEIALHPADVYMFGHTIVDTNGELVSEYHYRDMYGAAKPILKKELAELYKANLLHQLWNKVYNMSFIRANHIEMPDYLYGEDRLFVFDVLGHCETVYITGRCLYQYRNDPNGSLITNYYSQKFACCCEIDNRLRQLAGSVGCTGQSADLVWDYMFVKNIVSCLVNLYHHTCNLDKTAKKARIREILEHPQTRRKMPLNRSVGNEAYLMKLVIHSRIVWLNGLAARYIAHTMQNNLKRFVRAKHQKGNKPV